MAEAAMLTGRIVHCMITPMFPVTIAGRVCVEEDLADDQVVRPEGIDDDSPAFMLLRLQTIIQRYYRELIDGYAKSGGILVIFTHDYQDCRELELQDLQDAGVADAAGVAVYDRVQAMRAELITYAKEKLGANCVVTDYDVADSDRVLLDHVRDALSAEVHLLAEEFEGPQLGDAEWALRDAGFEMVEIESALCPR
jgi:hypothetical protein